MIIRDPAASPIHAGRLHITPTAADAAFFQLQVFLCTPAACPGPLVHPPADSDPAARRQSLTAAALTGHTARCLGTLTTNTAAREFVFTPVPTADDPLPLPFPQRSTVSAAYLDAVAFARATETETGACHV